MTNFVLSSDAVQLVDYVAAEESQSYLSEAEASFEAGNFDLQFGIRNSSGVELDRQNLLNLYVDADDRTGVGVDPVLRFLITALPEDLSAGQSSDSFNLTYTLKRSVTGREEAGADRTTSMTLTVKWVANSDGSEISLVIDGTVDNSTSASAESGDGIQTVNASLDPPYGGLINSWSFDFPDNELLGRVYTTSGGEWVFDYLLLQMIRKNESLVSLYESVSGLPSSEMLDAEDYYIEIDGLPLTTLSGETITSVGVTIPIDDDANQAPQWTALIIDQETTEEQTLQIELTNSASDPESGVVTYTVEGGSVETVQASVNGTQLQLVPATDFYTPSPLEFTVKATDSMGAYTTDHFLLTVTDSNDAPTALSLATPVVSVAEDLDTTNRVRVADLVLTDDTLGSNTFSLTGDDQSRFELENSVLYLKAGELLDYETSPGYGITISVSDSTVSGSSAVTTAYTLTITDVNEAPSAVTVNNAVTEVTENSDTTSRTQLADLTVTDDALGSNSLTLSGVDAASFELVGDALFLRAGVVLDHESQDSFAVTVEVIDSTLTGSSAATTGFTLTVQDQNEAPTITSPATVTVMNQTQAGTVLYTATATDPDEGTMPTFSLSGTDAGSFSINPDSGVITLSSAVDFDTQSSYAFDITATDGTLTDTQQVAVTVSQEMMASYWGESDRLIAGVTENGGEVTRETIALDSDAISLTDVLLSLKYYLGKSTLSQYAIKAADYNGDELVGLTDVLLILKSYLGKIETPPAWHFEAAEGLPGGVELVGVLRGDVDGSWMPESSGE